MAYDEILADRIRHEMLGLPGLTEKKMFGGIAFMLRGNMAVGLNNQGMIVRVGPQQDQAALAQPHVRPFMPAGKPMSGWVLVEPPALQEDLAFRSWVKKGVDYSASLDPK